MYVKSIEHILRSPVVIIRYHDETKRSIAINLRNIMEMVVDRKNQRINGAPLYALVVTVLRKKDRIEQETDDSPYATLWIYCESVDEAEEIREYLFDLHRKACGCSWSTGLQGEATVGRGDLDDDGYWQYGCFLCAREEEREHPERGSVWPFQVEDDSDHDE